MNAVILAALLAQAAATAPLPADAPVLVVKKGQFAPFDGILMSDLKAVEQAKRIRECEAGKESLSAGHPSTVAIVLIAAGVLVLGGVGGYAVGRATK